MHKSLLLTAALLIGLAVAGAPVLTAMTADPAAAAQTTTTKKKKTTTTQKKQTYKKKDKYCGYPEPPNQAGMSDYCSYMYNIYCRRGVGCSKYGRDFMSWDD